MEYRQRWFFEEGRDLFKVIRRYWLLNAKCFNKDKCLLRDLLLECCPVRRGIFLGLERRGTTVFDHGGPDNRCLKELVRVNQATFMRFTPNTWSKMFFR